MRRAPARGLWAITFPRGLRELALRTLPTVQLTSANHVGGRSGAFARRPWARGRSRPEGVAERAEAVVAEAVAEEAVAAEAVAAEVAAEAVAAEVEAAAVAAGPRP